MKGFAFLADESGYLAPITDKGIFGGRNADSATLHFLSDSGRTIYLMRYLDLQNDDGNREAIGPISLSLAPAFEISTSSPSASFTVGDSLSYEISSWAADFARLVPNGVTLIKPDGTTITGTALKGAISFDQAGTYRLTASASAEILYGVWQPFGLAPLSETNITAELLNVTVKAKDVPIPPRGDDPDETPPIDNPRTGTGDAAAYLLGAMLLAGVSIVLTSRKRKSRA